MHLFRLRKTANTPAAELLSVIPPRTGEHTLLGIENLLQAVAVEEGFSLELAGTPEGVSILIRTRSPVVFRQQIGIHYPQARIRTITPEDDPVRPREGEQAWSQILTLAGPEFVPLRTFKDDDLIAPGSDPLLAVIGALTAAREGERVGARLLLRSMGPEWSQQYLRRDYVAGPGSAGSGSAYQAQARPLQTDAIGLLLLIGGLGLGLQNYLWLRDGRVVMAALLDAGVFAGAAVAAPFLWKWLLKRPRAYDPRLIQEKISRPAYLAEVHLVAITPAGADPADGRKLLRSLATAYHHYDLASGSRFKDGRVSPLLTPDPLTMLHRQLWHGRSVLNAREVATLWHLPRAGDDIPLLERSGSRLIYPLARGVRMGALVGQATGGASTQDVRFTADLLRQHHLYVAKTRMGKSTLMQHVVAHKLRAKARDEDPDAIIVIDPHSDLVRSLVGLVPRELAEQVYLVDLADNERVPGINLLDTELFPDRDRATDNIVQVVKNLWEQWGPRMQSILEHTLKTLYEVNSHPDVPRDRQYTILDGLHLLADPSFRQQILRKVRDPYLVRWWARDFADWHRQYRADAVAPVQTRLAYYASSERARAILGQPVSTLDLREVISEGKVLLVSTAQGQVGREVSALIGGTLLNLVDAVIRAQEALPASERRRVLVVIDELQAIPGADYESMLSELGKFGASFIMATQSLARLEDLSRTLRDTIFSNIGCLVAFQVSAADARYLTWELDHDQVTEADLTSLPAYSCYVRATVGGEKLPPFSMELKPPEAGDPAAAAAIRELVARYTRPRAEVMTLLDREIESFVARYVAEMDQKGVREQQRKAAGQQKTVNQNADEPKVGGQDGPKKPGDTERDQHDDAQRAPVEQQAAAQAANGNPATAEFPGSPPPAKRPEPSWKDGSAGSAVTGPTPTTASGSGAKRKGGRSRRNKNKAQTAGAPPPNPPANQ
jgi:hypothetical protein